METEFKQQVWVCTKCCGGEVPCVLVTRFYAQGVSDPTECPLKVGGCFWSLKEEKEE